MLDVLIYFAIVSIILIIMYFVKLSILIESNNEVLKNIEKSLDKLVQIIEKAQRLSK